MKKLITMILLLVFTLPALAAEVRLACTVDWHDSEPARTYTLGFDEAAGKVLHGDEWLSITKDKGDKHGYEGEEAYIDYYITEQKFGYDLYWKKGGGKGEHRYKVAISRIDGSYSRSDYPKVTGTCAPAAKPKQLW